MTTLRPSRLLMLLGASLLAWLLVLVTAPTERTLGTLVRWVYAHASLTQVALLFFLAAAVLAVVYLTGKESWYDWFRVAGLVALGLWLFGFMLSMVPARLSWGVWVDWNEPRTQLTLLVLVLGGVVLFLGRWVDSRRFDALAQILFSALVLLLNRNTGVIRHPFNPIGSAASTAIPLTYGLVFLIALFASGVLVLLLLSTRHPRPAAARPFRTTH
ncbi:MAG: hypothetical protein K1X65_11830 [Caldilineales bacterium]|nr:hypothetical protein [Caldilineales bacterium]MCW5859998.1 hypothetical protein [Caldilineales bacterium]